MLTFANLEHISLLLNGDVTSTEVDRIKKTTTAIAYLSLIVVTSSFS